jgi:hypothetical protein
MLLPTKGAAQFPVSTTMYLQLSTVYVRPIEQSRRRLAAPGEQFRAIATRCRRNRRLGIWSRETGQFDRCWSDWKSRRESNRQELQLTKDRDVKVASLRQRRREIQSHDAIEKKSDDSQQVGASSVSRASTVMMEGEWSRCCRAMGWRKRSRKIPEAGGVSRLGTDPA